ncbi:MAG: chromosomal replication initiator protein DnaA [Thermoleophilaceae bacterium]
MPKPLDQIWDDIREELRSETPDFKFQIWIEPLELAGLSGNTLYVRAPEHIRTSVAERYLPLLRRAAARRFDGRAVVQVVGAGWSPPAGDGSEVSPTANPAGCAVTAGRLNPKYTFEQFVIGEGNRFAHAAALAVAELPAQAYNPLFLHGPPGLGKTHLLHAIGNFVQRYGAGLRVRYATIEEFTTEFVDAVRSRRTGDFKDSFRSADVVLIDDVQFLAGRAKTREEFFHTFNALLGSGRQLVISSDRSPEELPDLEARLVERFRAGLVAELEPPPADVRRAILAKRSRLDGVDVSGEVLTEIAQRVDSSVRALEGALIRVVAYASFRGEEATPGLVRHVLRRLGQDQSRDACGLSEIVDAAAQEFGVPRDALLGRDRRRDVSRARQIAMYLARDLTGHNLSEIGRGIGGRDHTTVLHAINQIGGAVHADPTVRNSVENLKRRLGHPA